jgi:sugar O-acyltransferase (sialic acid O-acetyltransferase NeuD family)
MNKPNLIISGASGHAKVVIDIIEAIGNYQIVGLLDPFKKVGSYFGKYKILGSEKELIQIANKESVTHFFVALGDNWKRQNITNLILQLLPNATLINAIHPKSIIAKDVALGYGNALMAGSIVNTGSTLDHDGIMENFSSLAPGVVTGGNVHIGLCTAVSIGATVLHNIKIGNHCIIGAGSLVNKSISDELVAYGIPAKIVRKHTIGEPYL